MHKENIFLKIITYGPLIFIPLIIGSILVVTINVYNERFENNIEELNNNLFTAQSQALQIKISNLTKIITYRKSIIKKNLKSRVQDRVKVAHSMANNLYEEYKSYKSEKEIKKLIKTSLKTFLWNDGESFIWIVDYDGMFSLAPSYLKHLEGSSIINIQDATGRYVIKEEIALCKNKGEGFIWDTFTKHNGIPYKQYKQVAYVKAFGHYNWYFGSSEYLDTATKLTNKEVLDTLHSIDKLDKYSIVLFTDNGELLMNESTPEEVGQNLLSSSNLLIKESITKILKTKNNFSLNYNTINPLSNKIEAKYVYFEKVPNTTWVLGSGFYLSDIEHEVSQQKIDMYNAFYTESKNIIYLALLILLSSMLLSYYISKKIKKSFAKYQNSLDSKNTLLQELNETLELKVKERTTQLENTKNKFEILATTDSLTSIHNRYSLMKIYASEVNRSIRYTTPLSVMMLDIDFFKKVNDGYGHDVGDTILAALSKLIQKSLRDTDIIGRYGGEEFMVLLPNTKLEDANTYAQRLRKDVDEHEFDIVGNVTVSIGLAELNNGENKDALFKRVDDLLYDAKNNGRNQVSYHNLLT